ncbi:MAG: ribonuclease HI [Pseudomonadota bacterium]
MSAPKKRNQIVDIYTDGSCLGNPGPGGWGVLMKWGDHQKELSGSAHHTTNNRMELTAAIKAIEALKRPMQICLYTDSIYVKNGITTWLKQWKSNGWKTSAKKPVINQDLWQQLDHVIQPHQIEWVWVKGHNDNVGNNHADQLAREAASRA